MKNKSIYEIAKKFFVMFFAVILMVSCVGCGGNCTHYDADGNGKCDECSKSYTKRVIFIGNSYTYYGQTVLDKGQGVLKQEKRMGDQGYFYQLCRDNGMEVEVTNWTFGGHGLVDLFGGSCSADRGCDGEDHKSYLTQKVFDFVVIQQGSGAKSDAGFLEDLDMVMDFFKEVNPKVKFVVLVPYCSYGSIGSTLCLQKNVLNNLKTIANKGVTVVDWGGLVMDLLNGEVTIPGSSIEYVKNTFVIAKSFKDGYHPNQLSGYITTLMTYCAITGESAMGKSYAFCNDSSLRPAGFGERFFSFEKYKEEYYVNATTNYTEVFASQTDMQGLQMLIDQHLTAKAYRNYNY